MNPIQQRQASQSASGNVRTPSLPTCLFVHCSLGIYTNLVNQ